MSPKGSEGPNPDRKSSDGHLEKATASCGVRIQMARTLHPPPDMARRGMGGKEEGEEPCARAADAAAALRTCWTEVEDDFNGPCGRLCGPNSLRTRHPSPVRPKFSFLVSYTT